MSKNIQLSRRQLDLKMRKLKKDADEGIPNKGWIRSVRYALGMSGSQLGRRLGVTKQQVSALESGELEGSTTLKMLRKVAGAMGCRVYYGFVPETSLEDFIRHRAKQIAARKIERVGHSMVLEGQGLGRREMKAALKAEVDRVVDEMPKYLWDDEEDHKIGNSDDGEYKDREYGDKGYKR
jgi:predicted DNA-binding mobile mystery protein A